MRSRWKWVAAGLALLIVAAAMAPWTFSGSAIRQEVARQIRKTTGLLMQASGRTTLALLPRPRIKIADVLIRDAEGKLRISSEMLRGDLRILPIFLGRLELASVTLIDPDLDMDADARPLTNAGAIARASEAAPASAAATAADAARLGMVSIQNGRAHIHSERGHFDEHLEAVDLTLDWPSLRSPAGVRAAVQWHGEAFDVTAWVSQPSDLLREDASPISIKVVSPLVQMSANGSMSGPGGLRYHGKLAISAPSLERLMSRIGYRLSLPGPQEAFSLVGDMRPSPNGMTISDLRAALDGNTFDGALTLTSDHGTQLISGTLATDLLVLPYPWPDPNTPFTTADGRADGKAGNEATLHADGLAGKMDLRISANKFRIGRLQGKDIALGLKLSEARKELTIDEASIYGGVLKGHVFTEMDANGLTMRSGLAFQHIDLSTMLAEDFSSQRLSGDASGDLTLSGNGETPATLLNSLSGSFRVTLVNGELSGLDLEQALRRLEKRPLSIASEVRSGRTPIAKGELQLSIDHGQISVQQADARAPGVEFSISGSASIPKRSLDLSIHAQTPETGPSERGRPQLALDITGNWNDPLLVLDTQSLIKRSEAAAPLLRSLAPSIRATDIPSAVPQ